MYLMLLQQRNSFNISRFEIIVPLKFISSLEEKGLLNFFYEE